MSTTAALTRTEWFKLRTTPALPVTAVLVTGLVLVAAATNVVLAGQGGLPPLGSEENVGKVLAVAPATGVAMLVLGIMIGAGENATRAIIGTYLGEPRRNRVLQAKLLAGGGLGAIAGAGVFALTWGVGAGLFALRGVHHLQADVVGLAVGTVLVTATFGLVGVALGALVRNMVSAIVGALVWVGVVELAVLQPLWPSVDRWFPAGSAVALTSIRHSGDHLLAVPVAAAVLTGWAALLCLIAMGTSLRKDVR